MRRPTGSTSTTRAMAPARAVASTVAVGEPRRIGRDDEILCAGQRSQRPEHARCPRRVGRCSRRRRLSAGLGVEAHGAMGHRVAVGIADRDDERLGERSARQSRLVRTRTRRFTTVGCPAETMTGTVRRNESLTTTIESRPATPTAERSPAPDTRTMLVDSAAKTRGAPPPESRAHRLPAPPAAPSRRRATRRPPAARGVRPRGSPRRCPVSLCSRR